MSLIGEIVGMEVKDFLKQEGEIVNKALEKYLPKENEYPENIMKAMRYSVLNPGKRIRPILLLNAYELCGGKKRDALFFACAIEFIHCYSLIHDDLPAMDDDDLRRGKPTSHKVFGEDMAILAGDALLTYAFETISNPKNISKNINQLNVLKSIHRLSNASGIYGMVGGQVVDVISENKKIEKSTLEYIHKHKTGALLSVSLEIGGILANADKKTIDVLKKYGECIGLTFQIVDDLLDIFGDEKSLGKPIGSDQNKKKSTYPFLYGIDKAKEDAFNLTEKAKKEISYFGKKSQVFSDLADFILNRIY